MKVTIISTGEELVRGETPDTNASFIARALDERGFVVVRLLTIGDDARQLEEELLRTTEDSEAVLITGGLGPTADDRSRRAIATALDADLVLDEESADHVRAVLGCRGREPGPSHLRQAMFPQGARIFPNPCGTARGFACKAEGAWIVAMPGVPGEMKAMFEQSVLPFLLEELRPDEYAAVRTVSLFGIPESEADSRIADLTAEGRNPSVAPTVRGGIVRLTVRARSAERQKAEQMADKDVSTIRERFGNAVFGCGEATLAESVSALLEEQGLTVSVAESCTGGLVGDMLSDVEGISRFFLGGVVAYSNEVKVKELGVPPEQIAEFGAVSPQVASAMAEGVCSSTGAQVGVSTTGICGPTGGTPQKPVGLVYVGTCVAGDTAVQRLQLRGNRRRIKERAAGHALNALRLALLRRKPTAS